MARDPIMEVWLSTGLLYVVEQTQASTSVVVVTSIFVTHEARIKAAQFETIFTH